MPQKKQLDSQMMWVKHILLLLKLYNKHKSTHPSELIFLYCMPIMISNQQAKDEIQFELQGWLTLGRFLLPMKT